MPLTPEVETRILAAVRQAVEKAVSDGTVLRVREQTRDIAHAFACDPDDQAMIAEILCQQGVRSGVTMEFQDNSKDRLPEPWEERLDVPRP